MHRNPIFRALLFFTGAALALNLMSGTASAAPTLPKDRKAAASDRPTNPSQAKFLCSDSHHSNTGHGANNAGGYQSTCDTADFGGNGQEFGPGLATGKPCAGCVGNADDKNPPGQSPDGSDHNSGYECDGRDRPFTSQQGNGNHGIGDENPAHTGCTPGTTVVLLTCPDGSAMPTTDRNGDEVVDAEDCLNIVPPAPTCPDGSTMTDVDGNGQVNAADCDEQPAPKPGPKPEVVITETIVATPEVQATSTETVVQPKSEVRAVVAVLGVSAEVAEVTPAPKARPTAVLGVQVQRGSSPLARTGVASDLLVAITGILLALGTFLVWLGRRPIAA